MTKIWDWWNDKDMGLVEGQRYGIGGMTKIWDWWNDKNMGLME